VGRVSDTQPGIVVEADVGVDARLAPRFNVILWDDDDHTYDYVIEMVQKLFGKSLLDAFGHAKEVDTTGRTILLTTSLEHAELKRDQIHAFGAEPRMVRSKGAMSATIEPLA
jgi:ATP-dependent Clp protease adaptor protein ClpS